MFHFKTEQIDKLSVPFGIIIGPCTVLSNSIKLIGDVALLTFNFLLTISYKPSQAYRNFKTADLEWEINISSKHKPQPDANGQTIVIAKDSFTDPDYFETMFKAKGTKYLFNWSTTYQVLSWQDKRQIAFEQGKQDFIQHLTFIGVGIIRSIPMVGGVARWAYNAKKNK